MVYLFYFSLHAREKKKRKDKQEIESAQEIQLKTDLLSKRPKNNNYRNN